MYLLTLLTHKLIRGLYELDRGLGCTEEDRAFLKADREAAIILSIVYLGEAIFIGLVYAWGALCWSRRLYP